MAWKEPSTMEVPGPGDPGGVQILSPRGGRVQQRLLRQSSSCFRWLGVVANVFPVKGMKTGISFCADGTNKDNLKALVQNGAKEAGRTRNVSIRENKSERGYMQMTDKISAAWLGTSLVGQFLKFG